MTKDEKSALIDAYEAVGPAMRAYAAQIPARAIDFRPDLPEAWTIREHLVHMAEAEYHSASRIRKAIAETGSAVDLYEEEAWCRLGYAGLDIGAAVEVISGIRLLTAGLLRQHLDDDWSAYYVKHAQRGDWYLASILQVYVDHWTAHRKYIERNLGLLPA